jgi:hypothetical protein
MKSETLKACRGNRSQDGMAALLGTSQKHVSLMESDKIEIPELMASAIKRGIDDVIVDDRFSLPYDIHEYFWTKARNRAGALTVSAWIYPSTDVGFAHARVELKFEALETLSEDTNSGGGLILDVMGNPYGPGMKPSAMVLRWPEGDEAYLPIEIRGERPGCIASRARCEEYNEHEQKNQRPLNKLAYLLSFADREEVIVNLFSSNGYSLTALDTIGFPLYPDFVLERISFRVHMYSLACVPERPVFTPFLIRRVDERAVPVRLASGRSRKQATKLEGSMHDVHYTFGPILRPAPGYIYSISWDSLVPN